MNKYEDIISLPHHVSKKHKPMIMGNRAAQFAPFAALTGYDDAISETCRPTDKKIALSPDRMDELSMRLAYAIGQMAEREEYCFTYFMPDNKKEGGKYVKIIGVIKSFDEYERVIKLENGTTLRIGDIVSISGKTTFIDLSGI